MMEWSKLLTPQRLGKDEPEDIRNHRTPFHKDYDRLVFSSPFRRLKDKTQVFSLAKNDYIRTRLIHSLEVSCIGRSLGRIVGYEVVNRHKLDKVGLDASDFGDIVAAACLAHDIGNPPFGHSGEDAIQAGFAAWYGNLINSVEPLLNISQKTDLSLFEGNAQGFRILARLETQPRRGGMRLTCPTLAAFTKYPRESYIRGKDLAGYQGCSIKKYGFFQAEKELFEQLAQTVGLIRRHDQVAWWCRHPLAFLMEAADDICYTIVDVEDGYRMGYISFGQACDLLNAIADLDLGQIHESDPEIIKFLRAKAINKLVAETADIFLASEVDILTGKFDQYLLSLSNYAQQLEIIATTVSKQVFLHPDVLEIRIAGYEVLGKLFTNFVDAVLSNSKKSELIWLTLPEKYRPFPHETMYEKILRITDYISGMSDSYATSLFKKYSGISLGLL